MIGTNIVKAGYRTKLFECWRQVLPEPVLPDRDSHLPEMPSNISGNPDFGCLRWIFR